MLPVAADAANLTQAEEIRLRYAAIVESSDDAIIAKTLDGVISAWNAAAERMFGYTEHEAIGQPITMIIPPDWYDEERDILRRLRAGERVEHYETVRVTKAGERLAVSLTISPLRDPAGRVVGCSKIARDITKAKQAEAALRQSEQRLAREVAGAKTLQSISTRLISKSTPESLYAQILDAAIELMASDAASVQILAADHTSLRLLAWRNFHPDSAAFWQRVEVGAGSTCSKALSDNERVVVVDIEACAFMAGTQDQQEYRRSGIRAVQSTPLRSRTGRLLGMLSTHWRSPHTLTDDDFRFFDVLARQAADLIERTLAEEALRESEERFRLIASTAPVMIWMSGAEKQITYLNQTWLDYTGQPLDAVLGRRQAEVRPADSAPSARRSSCTQRISIDDVPMASHAVARLSTNGAVVGDAVRSWPIGRRLPARSVWPRAPPANVVPECAEVASANCALYEVSKRSLGSSSAGYRTTSIPQPATRPHRATERQAAET